VEYATSNDQAVILHQMTDMAILEAASIVSSLSQCETHISVASSGSKNRHQTLELLAKDGTEVVAVSQTLQGAIGGHAILLLNENSGLKLIRDLLNEKAPLRELTEMEEEVLTEIGNIIINSCLSNYAQMVKGDIGSQLPVLTRGDSRHLLNIFLDEMKGSGLFFIELKIDTGRHVYTGHLLWTRLSFLA
jgi:chemotaxis protein CheC